VIVNKEVGGVWKLAVVSFRYYPIMFLEELRRITKISVRIFGVPAEIRSDHLPDTNQKI
jgi:hypothetical protein